MTMREKRFFVVTLMLAAAFAFHGAAADAQEPVNVQVRVILASNDPGFSGTSPELSDLAPPPQFVDPTPPMAQPDTAQDKLAEPVSVVAPPELRDLAPAPETVEPVTPLAPPDQPMLLPGKSCRR